ncbi:hypothetical protein A8709_10205 [Paenibacillus pectinilyticus]|uniref:HTH tetR-type domain-containing protein n=1 Tax=Paenibacillus pectinilyticus TaxID=512399 RepID=A0A1C1A603_9BACL|nr:TetR/AcrR family transcriptional regulator [Paenibacillus pectinilyticus]OCT15983.1 hypothetical protein A8709_10205 [Paenibacillus pectinilyticus]
MIFDVKHEESKTKQNQRNNILNQAFKLFIEKGIQNVTLQEIADACAIQRRTLYFYYNNKEDVALELVKNVILEFKKVSVVSNIPDYINTGYARIEYMLYTYLDYLLKNEDVVLFTVQADYFFHKTYGSANADNAFISIYEGQEQIFQNELQRGIKDGSIKQQYAHNIEEVFFVSSSAVMALAQRLLFREEIIKMEAGYDRKSVSLLVEVILSGLKA